MADETEAAKNPPAPAPARAAGEPATDFDTSGIPTLLEQNLIREALFWLERQFATDFPPDGSTPVVLLRAAELQVLGPARAHLSAQELQLSTEILANAEALARSGSPRYLSRRTRTTHKR